LANRTQEIDFDNGNTLTTIRDMKSLKLKPNQKVRVFINLNIIKLTKKSKTGE